MPSGRGSNLPSVPPPPILNDRNRSGGRAGPSGSRNDVSSSGRSRSPLHRGSGTGSSRFFDDRDRDRKRRSSPLAYDRDRERKSLKPTSSDKPPTAVVLGSAFGLDSKSLNAPSVSRVAAINDRETIVRRILTPENVLIPRRPGEGAKPIFDREELREGIERRMRSGDNDVNPLPEQRVIAIIREPMLTEPYMATVRSLAHSTPPRPEIPERQKTSTGMSYRLKPSTSTADYPVRGRSRSAEKSAHDRERDRSSRGSRAPGPSDRNPREGVQRFPRGRVQSRERRRRSRSRSVTPPPIPPDVQRNLVNRNRIFGESRPFENDHDSRDFRGRGGRGFRRPRGGIPSFSGRGFGRARGRSPGNWEHDMYDRERGGEESSESKRGVQK